MEITNFKGIEYFKLSPKGESVIVAADNALGKSTLADAYSWCLFGKDSQNQAAFEIKPRTKADEVVHGLEPTVRIILLKDGVSTTFKRSLKENYTKKRGTAQAVLTSNVTSYWVNDVPASMAEYQATIREIAEEKLFQSLTIPAFFHECLSWSERRNILLDVCGDVSDTDIIASHKDLSALGAALGNHTIDQLRKIKVAERVKINTELKAIPPRIDEARRGKEDTGTATKVELEDQLKKHLAEKKAGEDEKRNIENGGGIAEKVLELRGIEAQIQELKTQGKTASDDRDRENRLKVQKLEDERTEEAREGSRLSLLVKFAQTRGGEIEAKLNRLRAEFEQIKAQPFEHDPQCPYCGGMLPIEHQQKVFDAFNLKMSQDKEANRAQGKALKAELDEIQKTCAQALAAQELSDKRLSGLDQEIAKEEAVFTATPAIATVGVGLAAFLSQEEALKGIIAQLRAGNSDRVNDLAKDIYNIDTIIAETRRVIAQIDANYKVDARVRELEKQERDLSKQYEGVEEILFLIERFERTKVAMLNEVLSEKFDYVAFRMFSEQINGGLEPTCVATVDGISYPSANTAKKVNGGIATINGLAKHYDLYVPQWVDGCESVTEVRPSGAQQINLVKDSSFQKLTMLRRDQNQSLRAA
jgi:hypothetical protein